MPKIIAKTRAGEEFMYSRNSARSVSERSAKRICEIANAAGYQLRPGEKWHVYDVADYEIEYSAAAYQSFKIRRGVVSDCRAW